MPYASKYRALLLWQFLFITLSLSWLWAPWLNPSLSAHTSAISQFEAIGQPYSIIFRVADLFAAILLVVMAIYLMRRKASGKSYFAAISLLLIGVGMLLDPFLPIQCLQIRQHCIADANSSLNVIHNIESVVVYSVVLVLAAYDLIKRRKAPSVIACLVYISFGFYILASAPSIEHYATISQFIYQLTVSIWIAWFCREMLIGNRVAPRTSLLLFIRYSMAAWTSLMGVTAILLGLTGGRFAFHAHALYLGNGAWLTQHGVIVGVMLLYITRHLLRGELRARQIVLALFGVEVITYASITPNPALLYLYLIGFVTLFVLRDSFDRGIAPLTPSIRLRDLGYLTVGLVLSIALAAFVIAHRSEASRLAIDSLDHFSDIVFRDTTSSLTFRRPELLFSDTVSALIIATTVGVMWILFKPSVKAKPPSAQEYQDAQQLLETHSKSSEDFFKLWPLDKTYFWDTRPTTFLAYRQVGSVAYVLADPIGKRPAQLLTSFRDYCHTERLKLACLPVYETSRPMYEKNQLTTLQIGASAVINVDTFTDTTAQDKWWRWQRNRATKRGYTHHVSTPPHSPELLQSLSTVSEAWLASGNHAERGFALGYFDTTYMAQCTVHYLTDQTGQMVAFTNVLPQYQPLPTATIDLLRFLPDHNGTMPFLLYSVITYLNKETDVHYFDLGFVPFAATDSRIIQIAKLIGGKRFSSKGLEQFKNKFDPSWQPNYLAYDGDFADLTQIAANLEKAMELPKAPKERTGLLKFK